MNRAGFTLIELLVAVVVILLLMAILLPVLGAARGAGRSARCMSNLRQWALAATIYRGNHRGALPKPQGTYPYGQTAIDDPYAGNWYNALPVLVGAPRYTDLYDGSKTKAYPNANIWWCPQARARFGPGGFTGAGNAFDYAFNTVIDGTTSYGPDGPGQHHIRAAAIPHPTRTLMMTEPAYRFEYVTISDTPYTAGVSPDRHFDDRANMTFIDGHVSSESGDEARHVYSGPMASNPSRYWTTHAGGVVWGSFYGR